MNHCFSMVATGPDGSTIAHSAHCRDRKHADQLVAEGNAHKSFSDNKTSFKLIDGRKIKKDKWAW
jgi:hypothetical protein